MSVTPASLPNPYIGPRAFQFGEQLYGREQEAAQLLNLLIAERIVLLHSPSGAGKTSLIHAALIPRLLKNKFHVAPVIRVNLNPSDASGQRMALNRYVYSTLISLEEGLPREQQTPPSHPATQSLAEYMAQRATDPAKAGVQVLIFDQFEEVLTLDPTDRESKHDFFKQLGEALEQSQLWALFSMREDYLGALDPYRLYIPNRFAVTFRLDLLGQKAALLAIQAPARHAGMEFTDPAAAALVDDLRRVRVQQPDGSLQPQLGPYIEPVQLQVVCYRLWASLGPGARQIAVENLAPIGNVDQSFADQSLADYYAQSISNATEWATERSIREWFDRRLISEQGLRSPVLMAPDQSGGLDNRAIRALIDAHLVRAEQRAGATWFELSHDRLVSPIRENNAEWFTANLSLLQQRADVWAKQGRPESLLVQGLELEEARKWAVNHRMELLPTETDFLAASETQAARVLRLKRRNQVILALGIVSILLGILAILALSRALIERDNAERQAKFARAGQLAAQSQSLLSEYPQRSLLLALESLRLHPDSNEMSVKAPVEALRAALGEPHGLPLPGQSSAVEYMVSSADRQWLATSDGSEILLRDLNAADLASEPSMLHGLDGGITALAISPDGHWLAAGTREEQVGLWNLSVLDAPPNILEVKGSGVNTLAFSPDSTRLAAGSHSGRIDVWHLNRTNVAQKDRVLEGKEDIYALAFSPDSSVLAAGGGDMNTYLWDLNNPGSSSRVLASQDGVVWTLSFSPDGRWLATGTRNGIARLWVTSVADLNAPQLDPLKGHTNVINAVTFSPNGHWLATGSEDKTVRLWDLRLPDPSAHPFVLKGHSESVNKLEFSPGGDSLATGSDDKTIRLWDVDAIDPAANPIVLRGHEDAVNGLAFHPDGQRLYTGSADKSVRAWPIGATDLHISPLLLKGHRGSIDTLAVSPDGRWLVTGSGDHTGRLWDFGQGDPSGQFVELDGFSGAIRTLAFDRGGRWLVIGSQDDTFSVRDLSVDPPYEPRVIVEAVDSGNMPLGFSPNGRWLALAGPDDTVHLFDLNAGDPFTAPLVLPGHSMETTSLAISPDSHWLATGSRDNTVKLWNLDSNNPTVDAKDFTGHTDSVEVLAFSPDGRFLASGSNDNTVRLWDMRAADPSAESTVLHGHSDWVNAMAFSPDGRFLASGSNDNTVRLWDISKSDPSANSLELRGHSASVNTLTFSPDGRFLASGSDDDTVRLWDMHSPQPAEDSIVLDRAGMVRSLAFTLDGRWLASGGEDGIARLWHMNLDELIQMGCREAGRNLTNEEWSTYFNGVEYHKTCEDLP